MGKLILLEIISTISLPKFEKKFFSSVEIEYDADTLYIYGCKIKKSCEEQDTHRYLVADLEVQLFQWD